jgi:hypothetical protein
MHDLPDSGPASNWRSDIWELAQQSDMIQQGVAEPFRRIGEVRPGVFENLFEIRQRGF